MNSEMFATFPGMIAQQESISISQNMRWSYQKRMNSGEFNCAPAYGFDLINGELVINETEAAVIRRILISTYRASVCRKLPICSMPMR